VVAIWVYKLVKARRNWSRAGSMKRPPGLLTSSTRLASRQSSALPELILGDQVITELSAEGGDVADLAVLGHVAQQPRMILPERVLGSSGRS
jgi:hypothetical protein